MGRLNELLVKSLDSGHNDGERRRGIGSASEAARANLGETSMPDNLARECIKGAVNANEIRPRTGRREKRGKRGRRSAFVGDRAAAAARAISANRPINCILYALV